MAVNIRNRELGSWLRELERTPGGLRWTFTTNREYAADMADVETAMLVASEMPMAVDIVEGRV